MSVECKGKDASYESDFLREIDRAIEDDNKSRGKAKVKKIEAIELEKKMALVPKALRFLGAIVLIAATIVFLLQGWDSAGYILRYYYFLIFTGVLALSGFVCGLRVKEDKGARTFLALATAIVPAHYAQLGAFMYSGFGNPVDPARYPGFALWIAPDISTALITSAVASLFLIPIIYLGFKTLVRRSANQLSVIYSLVCFSLLVPTRDPLIMGALVMITTLAISYFEQKGYRSGSHMRTKEGAIARGMLWIAPAILLARNFMLYSFNPSLVGFGSVSLGIVMFIYLGNVLRGDDGDLQQVLSVVPFGFGWTLICMDFISTTGLGVSYILPVIVLPLTAMLFVAGQYSNSNRAIFRAFALIVGTFGMTVNLFVAPTLLSGFLALLLGMGSVVYGYGVESRYHFLAGVVVVFCSLVYYIGEAVERFTMSPWMSLAMLGAATIFLASYLERNSKSVGTRLVSMKEEFKSWS